jgi:hypothetical protein
MKRIVVAFREGRQIGFELGECMACLQNAGIRDYSAHLERCGVLWVADPLWAIAMKVLTDAGFEIQCTAKAEEVKLRFMDQPSQRISTATKRSESFTQGGKP